MMYSSAWSLSSVGSGRRTKKTGAEVHEVEVDAKAKPLGVGRSDGRRSARVTKELFRMLFGWR